MTQTEIKNRLATAAQAKAFNKDLVIANGANPALWVLDTDGALWFKATVTRTSEDKGAYLKPSHTAHGNLYTTADITDFDFVQNIFSQRPGESESVNVIVKVAKQSPLDVDESLVEARYADNPKAIANWKQARETEGSVRLVAIAIEEI